MKSFFSSAPYRVETVSPARKKITGKFLLVLRKNENYSEMPSWFEEYFP
ncbi:MAG: hypothetical protein PHT13_09555 [Methanosarcina sp.]|nr:hypothetical protein [Methanosarcina sp.]